MNKILRTILLVTAFWAGAGQLQAATYYIAADGSDSNDGLSAATPWQTIAKINSLGKSTADNSTFLFRRGDTFRGMIKLAGSTVNAELGAYGDGENPVISGSVEIEGWSNYSGNIYVADVSSLIPADEVIEQLFVDNRRMLLARYPNVDDQVPDPDEGWLEVDSSTNKHTFTDQELVTSGKTGSYLIGGNIRIRTFSWLFETRAITSSTSAGTIVMDADLTQTLADYIQPGWGYYIDNVFEELDHENEYYFDAQTRKVYLWAPGGVNPNTVLVEGAIHDVGCSLIWHYHGTRIEGLTFRHQTDDGININQSDQVEIRNCLFDNIGHTGVNMAWNSVDLVVDNNDFRNILEFGIKFIATTSDGGWDPGETWISNNRLYNTAVIAGYGGDGVAVACGIRTYGVRGLNITGNVIENTGYVGMQLEGGGHLVEHNVVRRALLTLDDGGGIFVNSPDNIIRGNIVTDTWGNRGPSSGTHNGGNFDNNQMGMGIFFQPNLSGNVIEGNTFANNRSQGMYPDRAENTIVRDNVSYNNGSGAWHGSQLYLTDTNRNNTIEGNILVSTGLSQYTMRASTASSNDSYDNDAICNLETEQSILNLANGNELTLAEWQASAAGSGSSATGCPLSGDLVSRILINDQGVDKYFHLGESSFVDHKGSAISPEVVVAPYSSVIVFQEQSTFYSLGKLISILKVLVGQGDGSLAILDIDDDKDVDLADAIGLFARLQNTD